MKKMTKLFATALAAGTLFAASAHAAEIVDNAGLLTDEEEASLLGQMQYIRNTYDFDINIYTTDDSVYYTDAQYDADAIYEQNGYGCGDKSHGILYYLRMDDGMYAVCTTGCAEAVFDGTALDILDEEMLPFLKVGDFYTAFCRYVSITPQMIERARQYAQSAGLEDFHDLEAADDGGRSSDDGSGSQKRGFPFIGAALSAIIAFFTSLGKTSSKKRQMNTAVASTNANRSMTPEGLKLSYNNDILMFSNITKVPRPTNNTNRTSGGSGFSGGGHHVSMSGQSHGGRSGSFR